MTVPQAIASWRRLHGFKSRSHILDEIRAFMSARAEAVRSGSMADFTPEEAKALRDALAAVELGERP